jgi:hypothetical protein
MEATHRAGPTVASDPTLSTLIPRRSTRRNLLLACAATVLLVGAWTSPQVLRPSVISHSTSGSSTPLARRHQVLTTVELTPDGWPSVGAQSVGDLPGARVAGAWVLAGRAAQSQVAADPADYITGPDYLRASFPHADLGAASRLPQRLYRGESAQLVILWEITDCGRLIRGQRPQIELTSVLGTSTREQLPDYVGPESALNTPTDNGACPTP